MRDFGTCNTSVNAKASDLLHAEVIFGKGLKWKTKNAASIALSEVTGIGIEKRSQTMMFDMMFIKGLQFMVAVGAKITA